MAYLGEYIGVGWENEPSQRTPINAHNLGIMEDGIKRLFAYLIAGGGTGSGTDGREVELRNSGEYIQWRYSGEEDWVNLVALADLKGEKGDNYILTEEDIEEIASKVKVATSADKITYDDTETKLGAENVQDAIGKLSEQIDELEESGIGGSGGQPIVVKTASSITDTTAIYLYMGEGETINSVVYEYGYIYTYDTEAETWVNSGLYGRGKDGEKGADGYTPSITTEQTATGISITVTDQNGTNTVSVENGTATDEQVSAWLDEHPEATTTVGDGSVSPEKTNFLEIKKPAELCELTYSADGYLAVSSVEYIDVSGTSKLTIISDMKNAFPTVNIAFYDAEKTVLSDFAKIEDAKYVSRYYDETNATYKYIVELSVDISTLEFSPTYARVKYTYSTPLETDNISVYKGDYFGEEVMTWTDTYGNPIVPDGTVTFEQTNFVTYENPCIIDLSSMEQSGFSGDLYDQFGAKKTIFKEYIDVSVNKSIYTRAKSDRPITQTLIKVVACYDENKNFLSNDNSQCTITHIRDISDVVMEGTSYVSGGYTSVDRIDFADEVKYARVSVGQWGATYHDLDRTDLWLITYEDILDLTTPTETYKKTVCEKWKNAVQGCMESDKIKTMVMIGDSLTDWGGGSDSGGFLGVVHDKTGIVTKNEGSAGAWWQTGDGQTYCGVNRVDTLISEGRTYDLYCFMLGTNQGSTTDTGETSADTSTMCGAIRYCLETLKAYHPTAQILVCLPPQRAEGNESQEQVNEVIKAIAESYSVKTLDIYHHSGIVPNTKIADIGYLSDGLHLGENGETVLGNLLASEIKYLLCL